MNVNNTNNAGHATGAPPTPIAASVQVPPAEAATNFETGGLPTPRLTGHLELCGDDVMRQVISFVTPRERLDMADALGGLGPDGPRRVNTALTLSLPAAVLAVDAATARVPENFQTIAMESVQAAMNTSSSEQLQWRDQVVVALATRVRELPLREQIGAYRALDSGLQADEAVRERYMATLGAVLKAELRGATVGYNFADHGLNITELTTFLELQNDPFTGDLQMRAVAQSTALESAWVAANTGSSALEVAAQFGITHGPAINRIGQVVIFREHQSEARALVTRGLPVSEVANHFNITNNTFIGILERVGAQSTAPGSAGYAARNSDYTYDDLVRIHEIRTPIGQHWLQLAMASDTGWAGLHARPNGDVNVNVTNIALHFGITRPTAITALEMHQVRSDINPSAGFAVSMGGNVAAAAETYGITTLSGLDALQDRSYREFAMQSVRSGEDVQAIVTRCGITDDGLIAGLRDVANAPQAAP